MAKAPSPLYRRAATTSTEELSEESIHAEARMDMNALWTATSLVSGTAVGAGILAIPSVSLKPGFIPSSLTLCSAWLLMAGTGFLIAEVTCNIARLDTSMNTFGLISITERLFGKYAAQILGVFYVLFHYTLLIAYIAEAGGILSAVTHMPTFLGPIVFTLFMGGVIAFGTAQLTEMINNVLFILVLISFLGLVSLGIGSIHVSNFGYQDYSEVGHAIPILLVALVFHNIVPTICCNLKYHRTSIYIALIVGSAIPLLMFILWNAVILGMVHDYSTQAHSAQLIDPLEVLLSNNPSRTRTFGRVLITLFSESAIITSFIGFVIGQMGYYTDVFPHRSKKDLLLYTVVLVPPMLIALGNPDIFLSALDAAGAYGISIIFGLVPVALTIKLRYLLFSLRCVDLSVVLICAAAYICKLTHILLNIVADRTNARLETSAIFTTPSPNNVEYDTVEQGGDCETTDTDRSTASDSVMHGDSSGDIELATRSGNNASSGVTRRLSPKTGSKTHVFNPVHSDEKVKIHYISSVVRDKYTILTFVMVDFIVTLRLTGVRRRRQRF